MQLKIRTKVNIDKDLDTTVLSPFQEIQAAVSTAIRSISLVQRREERRIEQEQRLRIQQEEELKAELLAKIYHYLIDNKVFKEQDKICESIILSVNRSKKDSLLKILRHNEFSMCKITIIEENKDLLKSFPSLPILVKFTRWTLGSDSNE